MRIESELIMVAKELVGMVTPFALRSWEDLTQKFRERFSGWKEDELPVEVLYNDKIFIALYAYANGKYELGTNYPIHFGVSSGPMPLTRAQYEAVKRDIVHGMVEVFGADKVMAHIERYRLPTGYSRIDWHTLVYG